MDRAHSPAQWVANVSRVSRADGASLHVSGRLTQHTVAPSVRANVVFWPTISLQLVTRPFVSAADYDRYVELVAGRADRFEDRDRGVDCPDAADFRFSSLRSTNVFRREYRPGSTLFIAWQQTRERTVNRGDFVPRRALAAVFDAPAQTVVMAKLAYRWGS